jgi:hypothetical protein
MNKFMLGIIIGSLLTGGLGMAGTTLYNSSGQLKAPAGSPQMSDYFRQRQSFLDIAAMRAAAEKAGGSAAYSTRPCGR